LRSRLCNTGGLPALKWIDKYGDHSPP
jgi:hypothetical protein